MKGYDYYDHQKLTTTTLSFKKLQTIPLSHTKIVKVENSSFPLDFSAMSALADFGHISLIWVSLYYILYKLNKL
ncbi:hypothetical protein DSM107003_36520 [Trichormus variabilis SAG 1403-4b]|jgi:hypothetical protein|uniref:Uncharacterized protein n=1 Tax=Trichormus variabilis SAG 1403-4b TaxID=447716 RepID=A0A433UKY3_ANAVA|nr:hypothetical protein DSM107003_36520 [Trichormus variabilis SAG 1403-4b]